jgi:WD40 repeat protein
MFERQQAAARGARSMAAREASPSAIRIFEVRTGLEVQKLEQGDARASELAFSEDGSQLLAWSRDGAPNLSGRGLVAWDLKTGRQATTSPKPLFADVDFLKIAPEGRVLTYSIGSSAVSKTLRLCDLATGKVVNSYQSIRDAVYSVSADWKRVVTFHYRPEDASRLGRQAPEPFRPSAYRYRIIELETGRVLSEGQVDDGNPVIFSPDPSTCVLQRRDSNTLETTVTVRDLATGKERRRFRIDPFSIVGTRGVLGLTPDSKHLLGVFGSATDGGQPGDVALFSLGTGTEVARLKTGMPSIGGSAWSPSGRTAAIFGNNACWLWTIPRESPRLPTAAGPRRPVAPLVRWTEGKIRDVAIGGGGRYLALALGDAQKVAIFDVNAADVVRTVPLASKDALVAAGAKKLVIAYPGDKRLERWDLESLKQDGEPRPYPFDGVLHAIAMGSDSDGPLLAYWSVPRPNPPITPFHKVRFSFIDLDSLKVLKVGLVSYPSASIFDAVSRSGGCFLPFNNAGYASDVRLCASVGGNLFGIWAAKDSPSCEPVILEVDGTTVSGIAPRSARGYPIGYLIPGADSRAVFTFRHGILPDPRSPGDIHPGVPYVPPEEPMFPSPEPVYSLSLRGGGSISIRLTRDNTRLLNITGLDEMVGLPGPDQSLVHDRISVEKRFHLVPAAKLLVTIPRSNDRLVLRRLDIVESLALLPVEYLFVTSPPMVTAKADQKLRHRIAVQSPRGGVTWALDRGPEGLTVSSDGVVSWSVPRGLKGAEETAAVTIGDASGRRVIHTLTIRIE